MHVVSLNLSEPKLINWRGKKVKTGIYKLPVDGPVYLDKTDVRDDAVIDRRYHGGIDKACYLFSAEHYPTWQKLYPELNWSYGMFGENITVSGLQEAHYFIGDILRIGGVTVQVSQPREPCFKLGVKFGTQKVIKVFIAQKQPGIYVRVLDPGSVFKGDSVELVERPHQSIQIGELWDLLYGANPNRELLEFALDYPLLADGYKGSLRKLYQRLYNQ